MLAVVAIYVLTGQPSPSFSAGSLTDAEAAALTSYGLTQVATLVENAGGDWKPTFWPYGASQTTDPTLTAVTSSLSVAVLTKTGAQYMGLPTGANGVPSGDTTTGNYKYVIFGMNKPCTLFRTAASEPPYHFADTPTEDPAMFYMPFAAVYMVTRDFNGSAKTLSRPRFMGSIAFHDFGLATGASHTKEWWDQLKDDRPLK